MNILRRFVVVVILFLSLSVYTYADRAVRCKSCGFSDAICFNLGRNTDVIAVGYCSECQMYVNIWCSVYLTNEGRKYFFMDGTPIASCEDYQPLSQVIYQDKNGPELRHVYACPYCGKPFVELLSEDLSKEMPCPRCGERTLESMMFMID